MQQRSMGALGTVFGLVGAAAAGALGMYYLDPQLGRSRRTLVREKTAASCRGATEFARKKTEWAGERVRGAMHRVRPAHGPVDDETLEQRVRAAMGHAIRHPGAIQVHAHEGHVRLTGDVLTDEVDDLLKAVKSVKGVDDVENLLSTHDEPGGIPALQGEGTRPRRNGRLLKAAPLLALTPVAIALLARQRGASMPQLPWRH